MPAWYLGSKGTFVNGATSSGDYISLNWRDGGDGIGQFFSGLSDLSNYLEGCPYDTDKPCVQHWRKLGVTTNPMYTPAPLGSRITSITYNVREIKKQKF